MDDFVLAQAGNPHPQMLDRARKLRSVAHRNDRTMIAWTYYLLAMADATGETPAAIEGWMEQQG